ncbi:MAG: hypothetical protein AAF518_26375, partial [Spirochaetota bacterium]
ITDKTIHYLDEMTSIVTVPIQFSPNGNLLAYITSDAEFISSYPQYTLKIFNIQTGTEIWKLLESAVISRSLCFSPSGKMIASGSEDHKIRLWNTETGQLLHTLKEHLALSLVFSNDGKTLLSGSYDGTIRLWDVNSGRLVKTLTTGKYAIGSLALSPDRRILAIGKQNTSPLLKNHSIFLLDVATGRRVVVLRGHKDSVNGLAFTSDGNTLISASEDASLRVWDRKTGNLLQVIQEENYPIDSLQLLSDKKTVASVSATGIKLWKKVQDNSQGTFKGHADAIYEFVVTKDNSSLATLTMDGSIKLWDLQSGKVRHILKGYSNHYSTLRTFSSNGNVLASIANVNSKFTFDLWNMKSKQKIQVRRRGTYFNPQKVAISPNNKLLAYIDQRDDILLLDAKTAKVKATLHLINLPKHLNFSPNGKFLTFQTGDKIKVYNPKTDNILYTFQTDSTPHSHFKGTAFSPDGNILAFQTKEAIQLINMKTGQKVHSFQGKSSGMIAFSPSGNTIATNLFGVIQLWDIKTGKKVHTLKVYKGKVLPDGYTRELAPASKLVFSPDGSVLATKYIGKHRKSDGTAIYEVEGTTKFWDVKTGKQIQRPERDSTLDFVLHSDNRTVTFIDNQEYRIKLWKEKIRPIRSACEDLRLQMRHWINLRDKRSYLKQIFYPNIPHFDRSVVQDIFNQCSILLKN